jgi:hypothetical protein
VTYKENPTQDLQSFRPMVGVSHVRKEKKPTSFEPLCLHNVEAHQTFTFTKRKNSTKVKEKKEV